MNFKELALKAIAPATAGAVVLATGALSTLAAFVVGTVPSNCTSSYGYSAGYGYNYGYGYGYDTASCVTTTSSGGGGGGRSSSSNTPKPTTTPTLDEDLNPTEEVEIPTEEVMDDKWIATSVAGNSCDANSSKFDDESKAGYLFACKNDITTKQDIDVSLFQGILIRKEMAKMISNYAINVMGMTPDTSKACNFNDVAAEDAEMKGYIKTACQLGLMGYKGDAVTKADAFNPNLPVSRAMFATLFARMMYGTEFATATNAANWAGPSLDSLKADGLLKNINPSLTEVRGYVWIVFDRANQ